MGDVERDILDDPSVRSRLESKSTPDGECVLFTEAIHKNTGYGILWDGEKPTGAHRVAYRLRIGPIPDGCFVCHTCDNKRCVRPEHLFSATQAENLEDMRAKGRESHGKSHAAAIKAGWTESKRAVRAQQQRDRLAARRAEARDAAGVSDGWCQCCDCGNWSPVSEFALRSSGASTSYCRACYRVRGAARQRSFRARQRAS